jgi:hypothetical protein
MWLLQKQISILQCCKIRSRCCICYFWMLQMLFLNVAEFCFMLHVTWVDVATWFFSMLWCCKSRSWCCGCYFWMLRMLFLNVANFSFTMLHETWSDVATEFFLHYVAWNMVWCCDRILFLLFFFNATVDLTSATVHLTSTVDLTALRPSGRPGASNAETRLHLQWQHNTVQAPLSCSCRSHEETKESNWHFGTKQ